jgi:thymidine kinase
MNITNSMNSTNQVGYLELIIGPMYSKKTSRLVDVYEQCKFCDIPVVAINHDIDDRYDEDAYIVTHDKTKIPCIKTHSLKNIWKPNIKGFSDPIGGTIEDNSKCLIVKFSNVILINEGQFFDDLFEVANDMIKYGKKVYMCGLDGDFERKKFGQMLDLIPLCDTVTKLTSLCSICKDGTRGIFSMRLTKEKEQTLVGSKNYIPVCRKCYEQKTHYV